jgi:hypothetical protein
VRSEQACLSIPRWGYYCTDSHGLVVFGHNLDFFRVRVRVTLQLTVSQSVRLGVEPDLGLLTRDIFFFGGGKVTVLSFGGALSDERSGLSFVSLQSVYSS